VHFLLRLNILTIYYIYTSAIIAMTLWSQGGLRTQIEVFWLRAIFGRVKQVGLTFCVSRFSVGIGQQRSHKVGCIKRVGT
jgi:hypothetical protein